MDTSVNCQRMLLVEATESAAAEICPLIESHTQAAGLVLTTITESCISQQLRQEAASATPAAVVLVGPGVTRLNQLVSEVGVLYPDVQLVFIQPQEQLSNFRKTLNHIPLSALHWSLEDISDPALGESIRNACHATLRRLRFRTTVARANVQLSGGKSTGEFDKRHNLVVSDHYLASFLAHAQDAIVAIDTGYRVLYWSAGAERLFERGAEETVGEPISSLPFWSQDFRLHLAKLGSGADTQRLESTCISASGQEMAIESELSAVRDEKGEFIGSSLVIRDISARNKLLEAERAERTRATRLIDSERRHLRSLFKQAPGFIAVTVGPNHIFEVANDAYYQIIGHRSILGKPARQALPEMQGQEFLLLLDQVYETGEPYVGRGMSVAVQRDPGAELETLFVDFVFQPMIETDGNITGIFCQGSDITQHKLTQESLSLHQRHLEDLVEQRTRALETSQRALQRSQKLEAIGKLTGGVAHDFNNVLQIIAGNLQLLQLDLSGSATVEKYLKSAIDAVDRGAKLSSQLLAFARRQPLQPIAVNLARILRNMDDLLRRALGETIEIETIVAGGLWNTMVDPNQLENVILNLSINARDAMGEGGKLTLELGNAMLDDHYVLEQPDVPAGQYVLLAISDTGKGMTPEVIERAFDPFFTTKQEGEGTGLGLSMAYGFIKQSGGHIKIYSEPGSGTTFKIYLPRSHQAEVEAPKALSGPVVGGSETILVVEDDPAVQETAVRILQDLGYKVLKADDGQSALNILQSGCAVDMLFTDVVMPGPLHSPDLAKHAKQIFPEIAVLFTSGYTQNAIVHGGRLDPGVELLSKPYRREDLARKIRHVFANTQGRKLPPSESEKATKVSPTKFHILVVEDNRDSLTAVCELLNILGHTTVGVVSGEEATESLATEKIDLLFTDINLPGMSGIELARQAVKVNPRLQVIIASGYGSAFQHDLGFPVRVLSKPFDLNRLRDVLEAL